jgi:uncharacterized membrane protein
MRTIIGVLPKGSDVNRGVQSLKKEGFPARKIRLITKASTVRTLLHCEPSCVVARYSAIGAIFVALIYGVSASFAGWCECNLFNFDQAIALETIVAGVLIGGFIGAALGMFVGVAEYEKDTHLYTRGFQRGEQLIVVETDHNNSEKAIQILLEEGFIGVKTLPES